MVNAVDWEESAPVMQEQFKTYLDAKFLGKERISTACLCMSSMVFTALILAIPGPRYLMLLSLLFTAITLLLHLDSLHSLTYGRPDKAMKYIRAVAFGTLLLTVFLAIGGFKKADNLIEARDKNITVYGNENQIWDRKWIGMTSLGLVVYDGVRVEVIRNDTIRGYEFH